MNILFEKNTEMIKMTLPFLLNCDRLKDMYIYIHMCVCNVYSNIIFSILLAQRKLQLLLPILRSRHNRPVSFYPLAFFFLPQVILISPKTMEGHREKANKKLRCFSLIRFVYFSSRWVSVQRVERFLNLYTCKLFFTLEISVWLSYKMSKLFK